MITTKSDGTTMIRCGYGTIRTVVTKHGKSVRLNVRQGAPLTVGGTEISMNQDFPIAISFCNVNAIDVWIDSLNRAKAMLQGKTL